MSNHFIDMKRREKEKKAQIDMKREGRREREREKGETISEHARASI